MINFTPYNETEESLLKRIDDIVARQKQSADRAEALKTIFQSIDFTSLNSTDNAAKINDFCQRALDFPRRKPFLNVASVCLYNPFIQQAKTMLQGSGIGVAVVSGAFPTGMASAEAKRQEVQLCVDEGADEVDIVINQGLFLSGDYEGTLHELRLMREACESKAHLKVIFETGELRTVENIRKMSELAIEAGADFIKTSTGKIPVGATPLAALIMIDTIKDYFTLTGRRIGFKPAGGMTTVDDALVYYYLVRDTLGEEWLNKNLLRFGTSRLAEKIYDELA